MLPVTLSFTGAAMTIFFGTFGTIDTYTASGTDNTSPTPIARNSPHSIALVSGDENNIAVSLPTNAQIGDIVELHSMTGQTMKVYPVGSDELFPTASFFWFEGGAWYVRKISSTMWIAA